MNFIEHQQKQLPRYRSVNQVRKRYKHYYKRRLLEWLEEQLDLCDQLLFVPLYWITYHFHQPEDSIKQQLLKENEYGYKDRYGLKDQELWNSIERGNWIDKRREDIFYGYKDIRKLCNVEMKFLYNVKRLDRLDKYIIPPMFYFMEKGRNRSRFHVHHPIFSPLPVQHTEEQVRDIFNNKVRDKVRSISRWKKIHVEKMTDPKGLMDYLVKETNINHLSLNPYSKVIDRKTMKII